MTTQLLECRKSLLSPIDIILISFARENTEDLFGMQRGEGFCQPTCVQNIKRDAMEGSLEPHRRFGL